MKKISIILIGVLLLIALVGTAIAETSTPQVPVPAPDTSNQDFYQEMYEYCHGSDGAMNWYPGDASNGIAPQQGIGGMMGRNSSMMGW